MKDYTNRTIAVGVGCLAIAAGAFADYTVTQGSSAPAYSDFTLNFDEPGGPTGVVSSTAWLASHGITIEAGDGVSVVDDHDAFFGGWGLGDGNSYFGNFGVFMTLEEDATAMSFQAWDPSGAPSPFGGGMGVVLLDDGAEVSFTFHTPAWGGLGDSWFDISTTDGMVFDEVRVLGFGFGPTTFVDNISWNVVPTPATAALLGLGGLVTLRRRR